MVLEYICYEEGQLAVNFYSIIVYFGLKDMEEDD
jgi:hypothetical protein